LATNYKTSNQINNKTKKMKIIKTILIPFLFLTVVLLGCKKEMKDVLFEDVYFNMNLNEFLKNQVHVQFVNANYEKSSVVPAVRITIGGKNSDVVYDINGTRDIKIENQLSMIVVSPGEDIPAATPLSFTLRAEAPGFMPMEKEITVKDVDDYTNLVFEMVEIANPPVGIKAQQAGNFSVVNYDATNPAVLSNMEGYIPNFSNKAVKAGTAVDYYFQPISYLRVDQQAGSTASQPQTQEFLLPANAVNNTTGADDRDVQRSARTRQRTYVCMHRPAAPPAVDARGATGRSRPSARLRCRVANDADESVHFP
jgi:hypothetical protein